MRLVQNNETCLRFLLFYFRGYEAFPLCAEIFVHFSAMPVPYISMQTESENMNWGCEI